MLRFSGAGVSDVGLVRPHNEDSAFVGPYVALVADGVGGAAAGEIASATAAYAASAVALGRFGDDPSRCWPRPTPRRGQRPAGRAARPRPAGHGDHADHGGHRRPQRGRSATSATPAPTCCRDGELRQITERPHLRPAPRRHRPARARRRARPTRGATSCCARSTATPRAAASTSYASTSALGRPAAAVQRRADRPGRRRPDRRGAAPRGARRGGGRRAHPRSPWTPAAATTSPSSSLDVVDGPRVVGDGTAARRAARPVERRRPRGGPPPAS